MQWEDYVVCHPNTTLDFMSKLIPFATFVGVNFFVWLGFGFAWFFVVGGDGGF